MAKESIGQAKQVAALMGAAGLVGVHESPPVRLTTISAGQPVPEFPGLVTSEIPPA